MALRLLFVPALAYAQKGKTRPPAVVKISKAQGLPAAPVTVEVFSDFQCPGCAALHFQAVKPLIMEYVRTGKVYLVNREFPLPGHPYARPAAMLANAAAAIGRYEIVADTLFRKQTIWSASGKPDAVLAGALTPAELNKVRQLAATTEVARSIDQDVAIATQAGIRETPTLFVVRGQTRLPFSGVIAYPVLRQAVEMLLKK
jgi:protein-disulfide isomerase